MFDRERFVSYVNNLRGAEIVPNALAYERRILNYIGGLYNALPKRLNAIDCYKEMFAADDENRRQAAWEGWVVEFYFKRYLKANPTSDIEWWGRDGELDFDLRFPMREWFYGDVKSDQVAKDVQGNKKDNIDLLIKEKHGRLWYVAFEFEAKMDSEFGYEATEWWNRKLEKPNLRSYCSRMKHSIEIKRMSVYDITESAYPYLKEYRPSPVAGRPRAAKYLIPNKMKKFLRIFEREG